MGEEKAPASVPGASIEWPEKPADSTTDGYPGLVPGRIVHYYDEAGAGPSAAMVVHVRDKAAGVVNLCVWSDTAATVVELSVTPTGTPKRRWEWIPKHAVPVVG